jgi:hypothetical protein
MEERFSEDEQNQIVDIIAEVLGRAETDEGAEGDEMDADGEADPDAMPSVENGY